MTDVAAKCIRKQPRFKGIFHDGEKRNNRIPLVSSVIYGDEIEAIQKALQEGTMEENISALEKEAAEYIGTRQAAALSSGSAAIHMALKLAAEKLYGSASGISTPGGIEYSRKLLNNM